MVKPLNNRQMSMFIASENHYKTIVKTVLHRVDNGDKYDVRGIVKTIDDTDLSGDDLKLRVYEYVEMLHRINVAIYNEKYSESYNHPLKVHNLKGINILESIDLVRTLDCLDYQLEWSYLNEIDVIEEHERYNAELFLRLLIGNVGNAALRNTTEHKNNNTWEIA